MAIRKTIQIGHPLLKAVNVQITDFRDLKILKLIADLKDTMRENELIGIAAPQIGENYQVFVTEPRQTKSRSIDQSDSLRVYINPQIISTSKEEAIIFEGCGSVLNGELFGPVLRPKTVTIEAVDEQGKKFRLTADGILAHVIFHEYDHLQGKEFLERVSDYQQLLTHEYYVERIKNSAEQLTASKITGIHHEYVS